MQAKSDIQLLREYAAHKLEPAFADLVHRHAGLVYSAALRQLGSPDAAGEIAQNVFIDLARKAPSLVRKLAETASLAGWLYRATRYAALNRLREERRRHIHERQLMQDLQTDSEAAPDWASLAPFLDEALSALNEQERDALLLRFFKNQDFRAVGAALGISDDTAQKRVSRSLEKLRAALQKRDVTTTTAALGVALSSQAVQATPAGLAAACISLSLAGATTETGVTFTLIKLMSMTKLQLGIAAITIGGLAATIALQQQTERKMLAENQSIRQRATTLEAENQNLSNNLLRAAISPPLANDQFRELLRLRGEVGLLRDKTNHLAELQRQNSLLREGLEKAKNEIPEPMDQSDQARFAAYQAALVNTAKIIGVAFRIYSNDNHDQFPTNFSVIHNELGNQTNFSGIGLDSFEFVNVGKANDTYPQGAAVRERTPRQSPDGGWQRVYLLDDGSVQIAHSPDGNFDAWEQSNNANNFLPAPQ